jgi:uncharacterized protein (DUF1778 family)
MSHQEVDRLEARISAQKKDVLRNAAALAGRTLSEFVISSAYEAAVRLIHEHQQLHLAEADRELFIQALLSPPKPSKNLIKAAKLYNKDVISR